jgi:hypothetical protein
MDTKKLTEIATKHLKQITQEVDTPSNVIAVIALMQHINTQALCCKFIRDENGCLEN